MGIMRVAATTYEPASTGVDSRPIRVFRHLVPALHAQPADGECPETALEESTLKLEVVGSEHRAVIEMGAAVVRE